MEGGEVHVVLNLTGTTNEAILRFHTGNPGTPFFEFTSAAGTAQEMR